MSNTAKACLIQRPEIDCHDCTRANKTENQVHKACQFTRKTNDDHAGEKESNTRCERHAVRLQTKGRHNFTFENRCRYLQASTRQPYSSPT